MRKEEGGAARHVNYLAAGDDVVRGCGCWCKSPGRPTSGKFGKLMGAHHSKVYRSLEVKVMSGSRRAKTTLFTKLLRVAAWRAVMSVRISFCVLCCLFAKVVVSKSKLVGERP